ncbi:MFS transporter [Nocardioides sp.]|uniref:MFS transporter n=1 Tax=Nocardioides sp. TaxID=35761 RepID=UPI0039E3F0C9
MSETELPDPAPRAQQQRLTSREVGEQTLLLCALIGTAQMTWGVIVPGLPLLTDRYDLAVSTLGPILAAFAIGRALANAPAGLALRWWRPRRYLWIVALALAAVTAATGLATTAPAIVALRFVAGLLGGAVVTVAFSVLVAGAPAGRRGSVVASSMVAMMSAAAVGAVLGGVVVEALGVGWSFVAAVLPLLGCLVWEWLRPASHYWASYSRAPTASAGHAPSGRRPLLLALCGVSFATFFVRFAGEQGLVPVMAYDDAGLTPVTLAVVMAVGTVVSLATMPVVGRVVDGGARVGVLLPAGLVGAAAVLALPAFDGPVLFGAALVLYFAATTAVNVVPGVVSGDAWAAQDAGAVVGLTRTVGDIGAAVGPLAVFWVADRSGEAAACLLMGALLAVAVTGLAALLARRTPVVVRAG